MLPRVCAVLPAGGTGCRMGHSLPKQFINVMERPVISYTIESFERISWVEDIIVVVHESQEARMSDIKSKFKHDSVYIAATGDTSTRHRSIHTGVQLVSTVNQKTEFVIIHDAVRPFIEENTLKDILLAAVETGAGGVIRPLVSTVLRLEGDHYLKYSLDRNEHVASEMPQVFKLDVILTAYRECTQHDLEFGTECLHLAQKYTGVTPKLVSGPESLWKVTHKKDLHTLEGVLKDKFSAVTYVLVDGETSLHNELLMALKYKFDERNMHLICLTLPDFDNTYPTNVFKDTADKVYSVICVHGGSRTGETVNRCTEILTTAIEDVRVTGILVHVFSKDLLSPQPCDNISCREATTSDCASICGIRRDILSKSQKAANQNVCLNGVIYGGPSESERTASLIAHVIYNRSIALSGQVFQ